MNGVTLFIILGVVVLITILKLIFSTKNEVFGDYNGNIKLIPWNYSENQGEWVSPDEPLPLKEMNGNIYAGTKEIKTTWKNFGHKTEII